MAHYKIGVDYGRDSVRSIIINTANGYELASSVFYYPRWKEGLYCTAAENQFRQRPSDYIEGLKQTIKACIKKAGIAVAKNIKGISIATTGSTPAVAVDKTGSPPALLPDFENNPNAMFVVWKDHACVVEAVQINEHAKNFPVNYLQYVGGIYSFDWFFGATLLHVLCEGEVVRNSIASRVEHYDWIPFLLSGGNDVTKMKRGVCSAGHKVLWAEDFKGLPLNDLFTSLDPVLDGFTSMHLS
jgi:L-ribulokinase